MRIGVLGTGMVGTTLARKFAELGHEVQVGTRDPRGAKAVEIAGTVGVDAGVVSFADAAKHGELVFNCTAGIGTLDALKAAGAENLNDKVLVDVANPLDHSKGMPPNLFVANDDSLGEQVQRTFPDARVVKALNTVNAELMVDPGKLAGGDHSLFVCGNDAEAKEQVTRLLVEGLGWRSVVDVGDITAARGMEAYLLLWIRLYGAFGSPRFNVKLVR